MFLLNHHVSFFFMSSVDMVILKLSVSSPSKLANWRFWSWMERMMLLKCWTWNWLDFFLLIFSNCKLFSWIEKLWRKVIVDKALNFVWWNILVFLILLVPHSKLVVKEPSLRLCFCMWRYSCWFLLFSHCYHSLFRKHMRFSFGTFILRCWLIPDFHDNVCWKSMLLIFLARF